MTQQNIATSKTGTDFERLLTERDAADLLRVSRSWLAKARMRGDGPPYVKVGRSIRYTGRKRYIHTGIFPRLPNRNRMQGRQTEGYLVTFAGGEADIDVVPALYLP